MNHSNTERVRYLDGLRGLAVLAVVAAHLVYAYFPVGGGGYIGVDVFFVVSGFVITTILLINPRTAVAFWKGRVRRLYPALVVMVVGTVALTAVVPGSAYSPGETAVNGLAGLAQVSSPLAAESDSSLYPFRMTWSLAVEWYFYLGWPFAMRLLGRLPGPQPRAVACWAAAGVLCVVSVPMPDGWWHYGPVPHFSQMLIGAALAYHVPARRVPAAALVPLWVLCGWYVVAQSGEHLGLYRWVIFPAVTLAAAGSIAAAQQGSTTVSRLLSWRPLTTVGLVSYSLYLWHQIPLLVMTQETFALPRVVVGAIGVVAAATFTTLSWWFFERPRMSRGNPMAPLSVDLTASRDQSRAIM